jgi:tetratricopeptide (TPR) repeat protein
MRAEQGQSAPKAERSKGPLTAGGACYRNVFEPVPLLGAATPAVSPKPSKSWRIRRAPCLAAHWHLLAAAPTADLVRANALNRQVIELHRQGRYDEAVPVAKQALAILGKALGLGHPDVATSLNNLAALYRAKDRTAEALDLSRRAVAILGKRHEEAGVARGDDNAERRQQRIYFVNNIALVGEAGAADTGAESDPASPPEYVPPMFWAPFVLAGEGGAGR